MEQIEKLRPDVFEHGKRNLLSEHWDGTEKSLVEHIVCHDRQRVRMAGKILLQFRNKTRFREQNDAATNWREKRLINGSSNAMMQTTSNAGDKQSRPT